MRPFRPKTACILGLALVAALAAAAPVAAQGNDNNRGTIKVHADAETDPEEKNEPHVACDFYIQGFNMKDPSGWIEFYAWSPTGNKTEVTPTGDTLLWTGTPDGDGEYDFLKGPYSLPAGHYRVEVYTDDGHPGHEHFAKAKMFWVDECEEIPPTPTPPVTPTPPTPDTEIPFFPSATSLGLGLLGAAGAVMLAVRRRS